MTTDKPKRKPRPAGKPKCKPRGRAFTRGHDDRRLESRNPKGTAPITSAPTGAPLTTEEPAVTAPTTAPEDAKVRALLDLLGSGGLSAEQVREIASTVTADALESHQAAERKARDMIADALTTLSGKLDTLESALAVAPPIVRARVARTLAPSTVNPMADALAKTYTCGEPVRGYPVVLLSGPSLGKTYNVRAFAKAQGYDVFLAHGCSRDMDEIATLVGTALPDTEKGTGFALPDGVLTQAWRAASAGQNVMLLLDEIWRLSETAQEWLLTALQPDSDGYLTLRTRRTVDGALEVLRAHTRHLHIVGAANLTERTDVVEAFWSRFCKRRFAFTADTVREVARHILASAGIVDADDRLATGYARIVEESRRQFSSGAVRYPLDIRVLESAAAISDGTAASCRDELCELLADHSAHWNDIADTDTKGISAATEWQAQLRRLTV